MAYLFTSESVSEGHPDKVADRISDSILDAYLSLDPKSRVACETLVTTGTVVLAGEITSNGNPDIHQVVRNAIADIGYTKSEYLFDGNSCGINVLLHKQSPDIAMGVDGKEDQGAGDQGIMFGYATNETPEYLPATLAFSHRLVKDLAKIRKQEPSLMPYLRPDAKSQVTIEYGADRRPKRVHTIVVSTQHDPFDKDEAMAKKIREDVINILVPRVIPAELLDKDTIFHVNPTGKFVIGGPHGDSGLTGRKIIVDTYGGRGAHGGGAFSGKDPSKVDRSAAYAARYIAKNLVAAGIADEALVQLAYAIGIAKPVSLNVNTFSTAKVNLSDEEIAWRIESLFDLRPKAIIERLGLTMPIYAPTAAYGHVGRDSYSAPVKLSYAEINETRDVYSETRKTFVQEAVFFSWERLDAVADIQQAFA